MPALRPAVTALALALALGGALALSMCGPLPARGSVATKPWDPQGPDIIAAARHMPPPFLAHTPGVCAETLTDEEMDRVLRYTRLPDTADVELDGLYTPAAETGGPALLVLRRWAHAGAPRAACLAQTAALFWHEFGHHVFDTALTPAERAAYTALWTAEKRHATDYADTNPGEGFAEAFSLYCGGSRRQIACERAFLAAVEARLRALPPGVPSGPAGGG